MEKQFFKTLISVMLIICAGFCMHAQITHTVQFSETEYQFETQSDGKTFIRSNNIHSHYGESGELCLPFTNVAYVIPFGSKAKSVTITPSNKQLIRENLELASNPEEFLTRIGASQEVVNPLNNPKLEKYYEVDFLTTFWRGIPIANIHISPFKYEDGNLYFVNKFSVYIELENYPLDMSVTSDIKELESQLVNMVDNPDDVKDILSQIPSTSSAANRKINYLVITSDELAESFKPLIEWKRKKGLKPFIMTVEDIATKYFGDDIQEKIKKCIYHLQKEFDLEYVVLGGDDTIVPTRYCQDYLTQLTGNDVKYIFPSDVYYTSFNGNFQWNEDGDDFFGTRKDNVGDDISIFLTRIPVRTSEHVHNYLTKLIAYERGFNSSKWNRSILTSGALLGQDNRKVLPNYDHFMSDAECHSDIVYDTYIKPYWDGKRNKFFDTYSDLYGDSDYECSKENLQTELAKSPMFFSMTTHGNHDAWGMNGWHWFQYDEYGNFVYNEKNKKIEFYNYDLLYEKDRAAELVADNYTLITTIACDTNMFDEEASGVDPVRQRTLA